MGSCDLCVVRNRAICAALDSNEIEALNTIGRTRKLSPGESLLWEGEDSVLVANVIEGVLKLSTNTQDGREQIVGVVYPSDFIGRPFGGATGHGVTALTDAKVCVFSRRDFDAFAREHPALEHKLLERTLGELDRTRRWMLLLGRKSAAEKMASFLLEMTERLVGPDGCAIDFGLDQKERQRLELPFSRQQIADVLGLTIETVSRQFTRLKNQGIIDLPSRREVVILDYEGLVAEAG
jgi:CRP/FNR family transcriptional regulator